VMHEGHNYFLFFTPSHHDVIIRSRSPLIIIL
jgi:hypothetical protein